MILSMDALQIQAGETFQSWATRIQEKVEFYEGWSSCDIMTCG